MEGLRIPRPTTIALLDALCAGIGCAVPRENGLGDSFDSRAGPLLPQRHDAQPLNRTASPAAASHRIRSIGVEALRVFE